MNISRGEHITGHARDCDDGDIIEYSLDDGDGGIGCDTDKHTRGGGDGGSTKQELGTANGHKTEHCRKPVIFHNACSVSYQGT